MRISQGINEHTTHPATRTFIQALLGVSSPWNQDDPAGRDSRVTQLVKNPGVQYRIPR